MKRLLTILTVSSVLAATASLAQEEAPSWYEIEVIIFDHHTPDSLASELWPQEPPLPLFENAVELVPPPTETTAQEAAPDSPVAATTPAAPAPATLTGDAEPAPPPAPLPYQVLTPDELQLDAHAGKLADTPGYKILLHTGWRQPVLDRKQAKPVAIFTAIDPLAVVPPADEAPALPMDTVPEAPPPTAAPVEEEVTGELEEIIEDIIIDEQVFGTLTVSVARYLHLNVDLIYNLPEAIALEDVGVMLPESGDEMAEQDRAMAILSPRLFAMKETRRMRSNELHYFDHPVFGVLAVIRPYTLPEPPVEEAPAPAIMGPALPSPAPVKRGSD